MSLTQKGEGYPPLFFELMILLIKRREIKNSSNGINNKMMLNKCVMELGKLNGP